MMRECVVLNGEVINIGPWDYGYAEVDGGLIVRNPLPDGAMTQEVDIVEGPDGGLYPSSYVPPKTPEQQRMDLLQSALDDVILSGGAL